MVLTPLDVQNLQEAYQNNKSIQREITNLEKKFKDAATIGAEVSNDTADTSITLELTQQEVQDLTKILGEAESA